VFVHQLHPATHEAVHVPVVLTNKNPELHCVHVLEIATVRVNPVGVPAHKAHPVGAVAQVD
jgi:hypothetical protein